MKPLKIYNSLTRRVEDFVPYNPPVVGMYCCGFTVYSHTHIGHIKKYVGDDILKRVLTFNGFDVKHVQNVTDVGHLTSDSDTGEDKMEKGAKMFNLEIYQVAQKFEEEFYDALDQLNVIRPDVIQRATDPKALEKQIELITILLKKEFAYIRESAIYFDVSKLPDYNPFSSQKLEDKITKRDDVEVDPEKINQADFVLWMFTKGKYKNHIMKWDSPWGVGFPGWHIECSAIGILNLGENIDIHTGGIDHLEIHHPDEIAQNYGVTGKNVVKYWVHHNFLIVDKKKMSKSLNNFYTLADIKEKGINLMALRYFVLSANYRKSTINFTWEALEGTNIAYSKLISNIAKFLVESKDQYVDDPKVNEALSAFRDAVNDDLNTPEALAILWSVVQDTQLNSATKLAVIEQFDKVLGLKLIQNAKGYEGNKGVSTDIIDKDVLIWVKERDNARKNKDFKLADELKAKIVAKGYKIEDTANQTLINKV